MCGLAGVAGGHPDDLTLNAALRAIAHRGPDGSGIHRDGDICLVHTRLSIIDPSTLGAQPMIDRATGVAIVLNGEIYNYRELKRQLPADDFVGQSDTEVLLRLFLRDGIDCVRQLRGMFAFAVWDPRSGELHLARDRFGIKPLFVARHDGTLLFGSEVKALLALGVPTRLNLAMVRDYLVSGRMAHTTATMFEGIEMVTAGQIATWKDGQIETRDYWSPWSPVPAHSPADVEAEAWDILCETARLHMISDVPIGISLSAGLDSQFIVHLLAAIGQKDVHAFTWGFDEGEYDEARRVRETKFALRVHEHPVILRPGDVISSLEEAIPFYEAPLGGVGTIGQFRIMQQARLNGVRVMLTGEGSDEIFSGYRYYYYSYFRDLAERGETRRLQSELEDFAQTQGERLIPGTEAFERKVLGGGTLRLAPDGTTLEADAFLGPALSSLPITPLPEPPAGLAFTHLERAMLSDLARDKVSKQLWYDDRCSMAWGVEARVPFLDHKLFEWVRGLPEGWLIKDGVSKRLPKQLLRRFCNIDPGSTIKHYVSNPQREWLKGPLFHQIRALLADGILHQTGLVNMPAMLKAYDAYAAQAELGNSFFVWKMLNMELMLRAFFPHLKK